MPFVHDGGGLILTARKTLTNAQILALPTVPVVVVPATQTINYVAQPTAMPLPVAGFAALDTTAGTYTNVDPTALAYLAWGAADESVVTLSRRGAQDGLSGQWDGAGRLRWMWFGLGVWASEIQPAGDFADNALVLTVNNAAAGNFTGGHAANTLKVIVYYIVQATS